MAYTDIKAELTLTMPDGWRIPPYLFQIPFETTYQNMLRIQKENYELEIVKLKHKIERLEHRLIAESESEVVTPPPKRIWYLPWKLK